MANAKTDAIVDEWKANSGLNLSEEEEQHLKQWLAGATERFTARRAAGKEIILQLQAAVAANDGAKVDELLQKLRHGFRQLSEGREKALDEFDKALKPEQRACILLYAIKKAQEAGRPVEQYIDDMFIHAGGK